MKKVAKCIIAVVACVVMVAPSSVYADDNNAAGSALKSLLQKYGVGSSGNASASATSTDTTASSSSTSGLSSLLGSLGSVGSAIQNVISTDDIALKDIVGTWVYSSPAVAFKSDNLLKKAGGAAAATSIESKLDTYYKYARVQSMKLQINEDSTFTMSFNKVTLTGDFTRDTDGNYLFNYKVAGSINIGTIKTYMTKSGDTLNVMYDVTKLVAILQKVGSYTKNSTINTVSSILKSYEGITAGFKLKRQN